MEIWFFCVAAKCWFLASARNAQPFQRYDRLMKTEKLLYDYKGAAELLSLSPAALRDLVYKGRGPVTVNIGRRTFFAYTDLLSFIEKHRSCL